MAQPESTTLTLRQIRERTDPETAARIQYSKDPLIHMKLLEACNGDVARLTSEIARQVVFTSEADTNRGSIEKGFRDRYGD
ncbi:MAG: hypothetical protein GC206_14480 [Alphaproteobacteria bacterium]|nr:hypothetical protein [Alphaproteobacteria bacterium]